MLYYFFFALERLFFISQFDVYSDCVKADFLWKKSLTSTDLELVSNLLFDIKKN